MTQYTLSRAVWRKSTRSQQNGACVEVAGNLSGIVAVRDSKDPHGPSLVFSSAAWRTFTYAVRNESYGR